MTDKDDLKRREPEASAQPGELSSWFTDSLRPSSFPAAETKMAPAAASATAAAPVMSPDDPAPVHDPADASEPEPEPEPEPALGSEPEPEPESALVSEPEPEPESALVSEPEPEPGHEPAPDPLEQQDEHPIASEQPATCAGHSLFPHVLPSEAIGPDESAAEEPLSPPLTPWMPGPKRRLVATVMGTTAVLASAAFLLLGRSCDSQTASPEASDVATPVQESPRVSAADPPPAPMQPDPADSAQAMAPEPERKGSPTFGPLSPAGTDATHWAPNGSSVARFPDLPPDVLLKLWQKEEQERKARAP